MPSCYLISEKIGWLMFQVEEDYEKTCILTLKRIFFLRAYLLPMISFFSPFVN